jgi:pimeloyl-ACP methyl ester carboxylesterase
MKRLEHALRADGYEVLNLHYASQTHDIATLARTTLAPVLGPDAPHARVHVVTHSLGGILVRQYLHDHGVPSRLGRIVMLAPPNQGSEVVDRLRTWPAYRWFNGPAGLQLGTDAQSVPNRLGPIPAGVEVGVIAGDFSWNPLLSSALSGPNDGKVSVARSHVTGEQDHIVVRSSHTWLMWRRMTMLHVRTFLREGRFERFRT